MKPTTPIQVPVFQRYDCRGCTHCCRELVVNVSEAERQRIEQAGWERKLAGQALFVSYQLGRRQLQHLAKTAEGACVFLGTDGRCRIHVEDGPETKPLACRLYPLVPVPGVEGRRHLDVRFDCPAVAANQGRSLTVHKAEAVELAGRLKIPETVAPPIWPGAGAMSNDELRALVAGFEAILSRSALPHRTRIRAGCLLLDMLYQVRFAKVREERFAELLELLVPAAMDEAEQGAESPPALNGKAARLFGQWLFLHALHDRPEDLLLPRWSRWAANWQRYRYSRQFARGTGPIPQLRPDWPTASFQQVRSIQSGPDEDLEPIIRAMRVKLAAGSFAGAVYFDANVLAGLTALWLTPALAGWFARLHAVAAGRQSLTTEDIQAGVRQTHHSFGVSPVFGRLSEQFRLHVFARPGIPAAILADYG